MKVSEASGVVLDWMVTYAVYGEQAGRASRGA